MAGVLYRVNGGEVLGATSQDVSQVWSTLPIGQATFSANVDAVNLADGYFCDGANLRLATQPEKDAWPAALAAEKVSAAKEKAKELTGGGGDGLKRVLRAAFEVLIDAIQAGQLKEGTARTIADLEAQVRQKIDQA